MSNAGTLIWSSILGYCTQVKKENEELAVVLFYVLYNTPHGNLASCGRAVMAKKCTIKCAARCKRLASFCFVKACIEFN